MHIQKYFFVHVFKSSMAIGVPATSLTDGTRTPTNHAMFPRKVLAQDSTLEHVYKWAQFLNTCLVLSVNWLGAKYGKWCTRGSKKKTVPNIFKSAFLSIFEFYEKESWSLNWISCKVHSVYFIQGWKIHRGRCKDSHDTDIKCCCILPPSGCGTSWS